MAVTPVRIASPSISVMCPTLTPATSVMALSGPSGSTPGVTPISRARTRISLDAGVHPCRGIAWRWRMWILDPVEQIRLVVPHAVDGAADGPERQHAFRGRAEQRHRVAALLAEPERPIGFLEDHRHPIVERLHRRVRADGDDCEGAYHLAVGRPPALP